MVQPLTVRCRQQSNQKRDAKGGAKNKMGLKTSLSPEDHGKLPDTEKVFYKLVGTTYVPDIEGIENLSGLTTALAAERKRADDNEKAAKRFTDAGVTPERLAELIKLEQDQNVGKHVDKGDYEEAKKLADKNADERAARAEKRAADKIITAQLTTALSRAGVIPERLPDALEVTRKMVRLAKDDSLEVLGKDGVVIETDFDKFATGELKTQKPWYYASADISGTGGENNTRGTPAGVDVMNMSASERLEYANTNKAAQVATR